MPTAMLNNNTAAVAAAETEESSDTQTIPVMKTVATSTIEFESDVPDDSQQTHTSGVLHATTHSASNRQDHCFAWLVDTSFYAGAYEYLSKFGFSEVVFIPYTQKKAWMERYPAAPLNINVDKKGKCSGTPYGKVNSTSGSNDAIVYPQFKTAKKRGRAKTKKKLFQDAILSHGERDCLHVEIYTYFSWLDDQLETLEKEDNGKRMSSRAGVSRRAVGNIIEELEGLRVVSYHKGEEGVVKGKLPFLEESLVEPLEKMADEVAKANQTEDDGEERPSKRRGQHDSRTLEFDEMFDRLMQFRAIHGHVDIPHKHKDDVQLAQWVTNIRSKKKKLDKQQQEEEERSPTASDGNKALPKKRKGRPSILDQEKIDKLDSVGFTWSFDRQNKSWEERYQTLIEYKNEHGHCNVPRKEGTFGEWVHMQRRHYRNKDKNFMKYRFKLLQDIGFEFSVRKSCCLTWDTGIKELEAFGRVNGHYNIPCPVPEHLEAEDYQGDDENIANAYRLYTWVNRLRDEYPTYSSGGHSRILNEDRAKQLSDIGFTFD